MSDLRQQAQDCKQASRRLAWLATADKDRILTRLAAQLRAQTDPLLAANRRDCEAGALAGLSDALLDRLRLDEQRIEGMAQGCEQVARLTDPVGREIAWTRPNGLLIRKVRVPLGVLCIIYEARPNVTVESACLAIKSGNGALLRGSRSALNSNQVLVKIIQECLTEAGLPAQAIAGVADLSHESITTLGRMNGLIDLMIPRGGAELIKRVVETSTVPVLETGVGVCHLFVEASADLAMAVPVILNSKCSRPAVCNSLETLLLDETVAFETIQGLEPEIKNKVRVQGCPRTLALLPWAAPATPENWDTESMDMILNVKVVNGLDEALEHIRRHSTGHTEAILTRDLESARRFQREVDACAVNVNASTRFTDGGEFGFGAEIGISTQKMHARGPVGLDELTTYKYWVEGQGQIR
ncbi:MAG: glutamate-5-semialdehyde dehydrogenase [Candidatus Eremiobacteraeota bacterium]|nr:glutamate-5-semialdehyde dehydrogenase [Candidatus Eremiobacteraeota bacterium]MCW5872074.1 glutamate-5-semialdehyde dehydrogenase [Candidatus Eremiobacteraeota bacterium]